MGCANKKIVNIKEGVQIFNDPLSLLMVREN